MCGIGRAIAIVERGAVAQPLGQFESQTSWTKACFAGCSRHGPERQFGAPEIRSGAAQEQGLATLAQAIRVTCGVQFSQLATMTKLWDRFEPRNSNAFLFPARKSLRLSAQT